MKRLLCLIAVFVFSTVSLTARSADRFVCDCASSTTGCVAGNDNQNGSTPALAIRSIAKVRALIPSLQGGDRLLWCRGGSWNMAEGIAVANAAATADHPVTVVDAYTPASGATALPRLKLTGTDPETNLNLFVFYADGAGFRFRNAVFEGTGAYPQQGLFIAGNVSDVTVENVIIDGFYGNVHCAAHPNNPSQRLVIRNSIVRNAIGQGIFSNCGYGLIENNTFDNNGRAGTVGVHHIYLGGDAAPPETAKRVYGNVVRGNYLVNNTLNADGVCNSSNIVVHNTHYDLTIDGNTIVMADGQGLDPAHPTWGNACYGIGVSQGNDDAEYEGYVNVRISNNVIVNFGGSAIQVAQCRNCTVENNVLVQRQYLESRAIEIGSVAQSANDLQQNANVVRHNTIYFAHPAASAIGIDFNGSTAGTQHKVANNLIYLGPSDDISYCFRTVITGSAMAFWNNNLCHSAGSGGRWSTVHATRSAFVSAYGFDANSIGTDPLLPPPQASAWDCTVGANSPAIDRGSAAHGNLVARYGNLRTAAPDIGACERDTMFFNGFSLPQQSAAQ